MIYHCVGQYSRSFWKRKENQILLKAALAIKQSKVKGTAQEIQYLGINKQDGCHHGPLHVVSNVATLSPPSKEENQVFIGLMGLWRMYIPGYSQLVSPLYQVPWKKNQFEWELEHQQSFEQIRQELACVVALRPVWTGPAMWNVLYTAARKHGLTWRLCQRTSGQTQGQGFRAEVINDQKPPIFQLKKRY